MGRKKKDESVQSTVSCGNVSQSNECIVLEPVSKNKQVQTIIDKSVISDIPVELSNNLSLVGKRLSAFLSYYAAGSLNRLSTLNNFIQAAEEKLYNTNIDKLDLKELNSRYKEAKRAQAEIMTIARQVSQQACEADNTARVDEVYNLLRGLSAQTLEQLQEALSSDDEDDPEST